MSTFPVLPCRAFMRRRFAAGIQANFECSFAAGKKQVLFDCAQGRLSTALASLRCGRDDRVLAKVKSWFTAGKQQVPPRRSRCSLRSE